jgi:hypothetical protein
MLRKATCRNAMSFGWVGLGGSWSRALCPRACGVSVGSHSTSGQGVPSFFPRPSTDCVREKYDRRSSSCLA